MRRGVDEAASDRNHGIGALWDLADEGATISIKIESNLAAYELTLGYSSGRIEPFAGELLDSKRTGQRLIQRFVGTNSASFYHRHLDEMGAFPLRDPEILALTRYLDFQRDSEEAAEIYRLLQYANFYHAREADLYRLKKLGSESSHHTHLWERCQNLWSVLRNIQGRRSVDDRYETIIEYMRKAFPSFLDLVIEQTGPNTVYGSFVKRGRKREIQASGVSDGHLQMLVHLTALFSTGIDRDNVVLFDEPETSLHPYALSVFAEAVKYSVETWHNQVFIATHSPVLVSQFEPHTIFAVDIGERGETTLNRVSEIQGIQDLLDEYAVGSLYMAEVVAAQSRPLVAEEAK
jgi:predicted ATPase